MRGPINSHGRIRRAAFFMLAALGAETASFAWRHPLSFYFFAILGGILALLGVLSFLLSFASPAAEADATRGASDDASKDEEEEERRAATG